MTSRGPRIAVIGNCQAAGVGAALARLVPDGEISWWTPGPDGADGGETLIDRLRGFDHVIAISRNGKINRSHLAAELNDALGSLVEAPVVVFRGFQPDCIYLRAEGGLLSSPLGQLHSGLAAAGYGLGLSAGRLPRLFNTLVFAALGDIAAFEIAERELVRTFDAAGYDVRPHFGRWLDGRQPFMHTVNHPSIEVLASVATLAAERAGLIAAGTPVPSGIEDLLAFSVQWPFYPDLARRRGRAGSLTFLTAVDGVRAERPSLTLAEFVDQSFRHYDRHPAQTLADAVQKDMRETLRRLL